MRLALALAALCAATPAMAQTPPQLKQPAPVLDRIELELSSWGRPLTRWSIDASGVVLRTDPEPGVHNAERLVTRRARVGTTRFREIRLLLAYAENRAGSRLACTQMLTDAPYGKARWVRRNGRTPELSFYTACNERAAQEIVAALQKADERIADWTQKGEIVKTEEVKRP